MSAFQFPYFYSYDFLGQVKIDAIFAKKGLDLDPYIAEHIGKEHRPKRKKEDKKKKKKKKKNNKK